MTIEINFKINLDLNFKAAYSTLNKTPIAKNVSISCLPIPLNLSYLRFFSKVPPRFKSLPGPITNQTIFFA